MWQDVTLAQGGQQLAETLLLLLAVTSGKHHSTTHQGRDAGGHPSGASLGLGAQVSDSTPDSSSRDSCLKSPKPALAKGKVRTDLTDLVDLFDRPPQSCS